MTAEPNHPPHRHRMLRARYGLTPDAYQQILDKQNGVCVLCAKPADPNRPPLHVDHDHKCCPGRTTCGQCVRGLLCATCNTALGTVDRNGGVGWLINAAAYLGRHAA